MQKEKKSFLGVNSMYTHAVSHYHRKTCGVVY